MNLGQILLPTLLLWALANLLFTSIKGHITSLPGDVVMRHE